MHHMKVLLSSNWSFGFTFLDNHLCVLFSLHSFLYFTNDYDMVKEEKADYTQFEIYQIQQNE